MLFRGRNFDIDFFDADDVEKYEAAVDQYAQDAEARKDGESVPEYIRRICDACYRFFDALGGDGTSDALFDRDNIMDCAEAFSEFFAAAQAQQDEDKQRMSSIFPPRAAAIMPNRAQRRASRG